MEGIIEGEGLCQVVVERRKVEYLRESVHVTGIKKQEQRRWDRGRIVEYS